MKERVVDSNVFLHSRGDFDFEKVYITPDISEELKSSKGKNNLINVNYEVRNPSKESINTVKDKSNEINSPTSDADEKILSLALDLNKPLVTDDKPLQNLAIHLNIDFEGYLDDPATKRFRWKRLCSNCGSKVPDSRCNSCGSTRVRRKRVGYSSE